MADLPRIRDAKGVMAEIKKIDPDTYVTENLIRGIINQKKVPVIEAGRRKLVNLDQILTFLAEESTGGPISYCRDRRGN